MDQATLLADLARFRPLDDRDRQAHDAILALAGDHEQAWHRGNIPGHVTSSAWVVDETWEYALLVFHKKLQRWLQLGGHIDDDPTLPDSALREVREESGLSRIRLASQHIFDIDIHEIPARKTDPAHLHFDVRYLVIADNREPIQCSDESDDLQWVPVRDLANLTDEVSVTRMADRASQFLSATTVAVA